jgi:hypothetical protein
VSRKYLRVSVETPYDSVDLYAPLEDGEEYTQEDLLAIGQDTVNNWCSWGIGEGPIDESEVPEGERSE